ncbi:MAG: DinB family protein [Thermoanaerobaculia bacterium]|nr:DinB family protein [Thermoanaerobaculia bacterium]
MDLRAHLLAILDRAYDVNSWHGPNLKGSLRGLSPAVAFFRPGPKRHSIYDLVLHAAYWKYTVRRRLAGEKRGSFALEGSNFFPAPPRSTAREVAAAKLLLESEHRKLREVVQDLPEEAFGARLGRRTVEATISGVAAHDLYHAGQIQLLKKLFAESGSGRRPR